MKYPVALITVVYNNYVVLDDFLQSLRNQSNTGFHLIIADASAQKKNIDTTGLNATVLPIENNGYAYGVNKGLHHAITHGMQRFCVINDDVFFKKDFIQSLLTAFDTYPHAAFGGKIYYAPGYEYYTDRYTEKDQGNVIWYAGGQINWDHATTTHIGVDEIDTGHYDHVTETEFITGCLFCFDQSVVDAVGYWDEDYFMYYEDADYSVRIVRHGITLSTIPSIRIWHKNAQSTDGAGSELHQSFQKKAQFRFAMKHAPLRTKLHILKNYLLH